LRGVFIVSGLIPVCDPFLCISGHIQRAVWTLALRVTAYLDRMFYSATYVIGVLAIHHVSPRVWVAGIASSGFFPFRFGRQAFIFPATITFGAFPIDSDNRPIAPRPWKTASRSFTEPGSAAFSFTNTPHIFPVGDLGNVDIEGPQFNRPCGALVTLIKIGTHQELARRNIRHTPRWRLAGLRLHLGGERYNQQRNCRKKIISLSHHRK